MANNVAGFELDHKRVVLEQIIEDPFQFILEKSQEIHECRQGKFILATAEIFMPKTTELATVFKSNAFISGATTVMAALLESDQDPKTVSRIQKSICMQSIPLGLLADNPEETAIAFEDEAVKGLQAHPEIRDHLDYIAEYYAKTTKDTIYGRDVCTGAGFYLSRLDRSYASVINQDISKWLGVEVEKIDWDKLFE